MPNKSNAGLKFVVVAVLLAAVAAGLVFFLRPVAQVVAVTKGRAINAVPGSVVVRAEKFMELKSEVGGRILTSELDPGKKVKEGDVLVQIDTGDLDLEIDRIKSEYEAAKSRLEVGSSIALELQTAQDNLAFYEKQTERGNYPKADLEKRRREMKATEQKRELEKITDNQSLATYENTLKVKQRQREKMTIKAPFDGQVTAVYAYKGALIGANEQIGTLITITRTVEAKISEENFAGIRLGQKASVTFLGGAGTKDPNWLYSAKVSKILPTADPETQRYVVYLDVDIEPENLIPGKTGEVTIVVGEREAQAIVPRRALLGNYLYVVSGGHVERRTVETGYVWLTGVEITKGAAVGEDVIVEDIDTFRDGQGVRSTRVTPATANLAAK